MYVKFYVGNDNGAGSPYWEEAKVDEFFVEIAGHEYSFKEDKESEWFIISETTAEKDKHFKK